MTGETSIGPAVLSDEHTAAPIVCRILGGDLEVAAMTHRGGRRENQDRFLMAPEQDLLIVADGVGGLRDGGLAATLACESILADVTAGLALDRAVSRASTAVAKESVTRGLSSGMGTTVVALRWRAARMELVWVGDSSARTYSDGACHHLTRDHTQVSEWTEQGILTESTASGHLNKHVLTQALGITVASELRLGRNGGALRQGEWIMLASDGVTNTLSASDISAVLDTSHDVKAATEALMRATLDRAPSDNVTMVLARWTGASGTAETMPRVYPHA